MNIGFIGLGVMGRPMALHLVERGYTLGVYARRAASAAPLVAAGATAYAMPAELAARSEVVFTMVTNTGDVEDVVLGENGIIHGARAAAVVVDMSTISPTTTRAIAGKLAARGVDMLDAPVSGGPAGAREATLSIMVGGKPAVFERIRPLFECLGRTILHIGDHGAGQIAKACNQLALVVAAQGAAEALALARRCGVDPARVRDVMLGGIAASRVLELFGKRMVERDFHAGIETRLYHKDVHVVLELAHDLGLAAPAAAVTMQCINALVGAGEEKSDFSALIKVVEKMSGR